MRLGVIGWAMIVACKSSEPDPVEPDAEPAPGGDLFLPHTTYAAGSQVIGVAVGDLDGDGHPDVAIANRLETGTVSVLRGNGDGTFGTPVAYPSGEDPQAIAIADLDGDDVADVVTANTSGKASVSLGHGDGSLAPAVSHTGAAYGMSVTTGDLDEDGVIDLATGGFDVVVVLSATMIPSTVVSYGELPVGIAIADLDGDGHQDLATANLGPGRGPSTTSILLGRGDGTFGPKQDFAVGSNAQSIAIGDFDHDGRPDVAVANYVDGTISVLFGNGDGTFAPQSIVYTGHASAVAAGDLDGDGTSDLAVASNGTIDVLRSHGDRTFAPRESYACGCGGRIVLADLNGDGRLDVVGADASWGEFLIVGGAKVGVLLHR